MPIKVRLGQNWYVYSDLALIDRDIAAAEIVLQQSEKAITMKRRNLDNLRAGKVALAEEVAAMREKQRAQAQAARAEKRHRDAETDDGEA